MSKLKAKRRKSNVVAKIVKAMEKMTMVGVAIFQASVFALLITVIYKILQTFI